MNLAKKSIGILILATPLALCSCSLWPFQPSVKETRIKISDPMAQVYEVGDIFDDYIDHGGMSVDVVMSDNSTIHVIKDAYTYEIKSEFDDSKVDGTKPFEKPGKYVVTVTKGELTPLVDRITVKDESDDPDYETISVEEAVAIIQTQEDGVVSDKEYYVRGIASNVEKDANGFNGGFLNSNLKFRSVNGNGVASEVDEIDGKEIVIFGYLELYHGIYQIPYLPANSSPTGVKYNAKLISVKSESSEEDVEVTNISISPVNKTLVVDESATLSVNILPENATDKSVSWVSRNTGICSVSSTGVIKGIAIGETSIIAKTSNGKSAICNVAVVKDDSPIVGDKYEIAFNKFESDGQTELNSTSILDQVTSGSTYVDSFTELNKVYKGMEGLKIGTSRTGGSIVFEVSDTFKTLNCTGIIVDTVQYGTKSTTVNIFANENQIASGSSSDSEIIGLMEEPIIIERVEVSTGGRCYISKINLVCEDANQIPVTSISIPKSKTVSIGNSEQLTVTYTPSNANSGKKVTWTTSSSAIATVSNGLVTGVSAGSAIITATSEGGLVAKCTVTVEKVEVTSISISPSSETLYVGATKNLNATVSPSNATDKTVTWTSSNSSVASVTSGGVVTANAAGTATITAKTSNNKTATCTITVEQRDGAAWTIMIYMCGSDLESESGLATSDLKEILSVDNQPDDINILVQTGGSKKWTMKSTYLSGATSISSSNLSRWRVSNKKLVLDETLTNASMGKSTTLQSFVEWGIEEYPAEKTGVIFWNHGGAMYGCCYDEKYSDDSLTNSEMKTAFKNAFANTDTEKLEFVGYDTCLTQVQDIAEFNSTYFNYMIASEEAENGEGWDYDTWIDDVYSYKSTDKILTAIVDGFITDNGGQSSSRSDQTLSWLDLSQMSAYKTAFESFALALKNKLSDNSVTKKTFASWMNTNVKAFCVDSEEDEAYYCLFDVKDMLNKLSGNSSYNPGSSYIDAVNEAFSNLVKYSVAQKGAGKAYGLGCIYVQSSTYSSYIKEAYTSSETNFSNWLSFCKTYSYLA